MSTNPNPINIEIAIIGSGLIGTLLALGLLNIPIPNTTKDPQSTNEGGKSTSLSIKIYEQSPTAHELGAGIGFTACARKCMALMDPRIAECVARVATLNGEPEDPDYCMRFVDGFRTYTEGDCSGTMSKGDAEEGIGVDVRGVGSDRVNDESDRRDEDKDDDGGEGVYVSGKVYKLYAGPRGFEGCHRGQFLEEVMKLMPEGAVEYSKRVEGYEYLPSGRIQLGFSDGGRVECDLGKCIFIQISKSFLNKMLISDQSSPATASNPSFAPTSTPRANHNTPTNSPSGAWSPWPRQSKS